MRLSSANSAWKETRTHTTFCRVTRLRSWVLPGSISGTRLGLREAPYIRALCGVCWRFVHDAAVGGRWAVAPSFLPPTRKPPPAHHTLVQCLTTLRGSHTHNTQPMLLAHCLNVQRMKEGQASTPQQTKNPSCRNVSCLRQWAENSSEEIRMRTTPFLCQVGFGSLFCLYCDRFADSMLVVYTHNLFGGVVERARRRVKNGPPRTAVDAGFSSRPAIFWSGSTRMSFILHPPVSTASHPTTFPALCCTCKVKAWGVGGASAEGLSSFSPPPHKT